MWRTIGNLSGVQVVYVMGTVNALLALVQAFGVQLSTRQTGAVTTAVNAVLVLVLHLASRTQTRTPSTPAGS